MSARARRGDHPSCLIHLAVILAQGDKLPLERPRSLSPLISRTSDAYRALGSCRVCRVVQCARTTVANGLPLPSSLNGIDKEWHFPGRLQKFARTRLPNGDTVGRLYSPPCCQTPVAIF
jgi:hypothetical protein